jgi:ATP-dependent Lon protease
MTEASRRDRPLPDRVPLLPLRSTVLFPAAVIGLQVATERSLRLAEAMAVEPGLLVILGAQGEAEEPATFEELARVGVLAEVVQVLRLGQTLRQIYLHGLRRVVVTSLVATEPYLLGRVEEAPEPEESSPLEMDLLIGQALARFEGLVAKDSAFGAEVLELLRMNVQQGPGVVADLMASNVDLPAQEKQRLVEILDPAARLRHMMDLVERELNRRAVEHDVESQVRGELEEKKREYILREQLRVIRESLGEPRGPQAEAEELTARVVDLPVDDESKSVLLKECRRLAVLTEQSAEYPMLHGYFETVFSLPWGQRTRGSLNLNKVERVLSRNHYGLEEVKERVLEHLAVTKLKGQHSGPILCLAGPPGTGKTSLARAIAEALGRHFIRISLGGVTDESEIRGHRKTYVGAMPGKVLAAYLRVGSCNPVILLDEIDKLGAVLRGDPASALLEVLDPEQNDSFLDRYLGIPFDLSETLFIATANRLDTIPVPLRDRLEVITLSGYTEDEKIHIARRHILPAALEEHGLPPRAVRIEGNALARMIRGYTSEAGVRELARRIAAICRKVARQRAARLKRPRTVRVGEHHLERWLGTQVYEHELAGREAEVGIATGLAWTGAGGEILVIEAAAMPGSGKVEVTGHLGEIMKESVQAAWSYVRSRAKDLEIPPEAFSNQDVHIHFPAGSIPKDGPSAGVAAAICLASLLSGRPVRQDVAMSGEITLRGKVLPVGGIKEKVLAAHRAQVRTVILPKGNEKDLSRIPPEVLEEIQIVLAPRVEDVWREALLPFLVVRKQDMKRYEEGEFTPKSKVG